jgi:putative CocE/NonD family hydrolase
VRFYQYGENRWIEAERWPPPHREQRWYLHSGGAANTRDGDGTLSPVAPTGAEPVDSYRYDPADPTPTVGGKTLMPTIMYAGIYDQGPVEDRPDVLCYTSPILLEPVAVNGKITVELWVTTSAVDTDFTAKLVDVSPTGYCAPMADGIVRGRVHAPADGPDPLQPGKPHRFTIDLWDLAHTFEAGHRIRVEIASANFPRFDRNLNNGGPLDTGTLADAVVAVQHVLHDVDHPSCLVLPVR